MCESEPGGSQCSLEVGMKKVRWCWWVAAAKAYPWAEEKEPMGWLCIEQGHRLAGERVRAQGRITLRHSDSGREDQGRWEGKDDSQALCGFSFPSEDGYDVISEIVGRVLGIKMIWCRL